MQCSACGHGNRATARFCDHCGVALSGAARAKAPPVAAADRALRDYTPKHLADRILRSRSALEGEHKRVTVFFADVKGSQELAATVDPEEWHGILDRFFRILAEGIHRFEGTINQFLGDGIMALFGAPIAHEDHAQRACHAALHLRDELKSYADELRVTRGLNFSVRMGLNSGEVVVGKIGDDLRMDYTAQGYTVGLAQRMEQIAESGHAYLTGRTARLVEGFFELRSLGLSPVKGSEEPERVYSLEKLGSLRSRLDVSRARGFSRFVGRADEMSVLELALEDALNRHGRVVGIVADAGTGKSRLCYEFAESCRARGVTVCEAHGLAHGRLMPMLPMLELLRSFFGIEEGDSDRVARERIAGRLLLLDEDLSDELPLVFDLMGVPDSARPLQAMDPDAHHQRILQAIKRMVLTDRDPLVLVIEDLHWFDAASDGILAQIIEATAATAALVVVNVRPEYSAAWQSEPHYQQVSLQALDPGASGELLSDLLGDDPSVRHLAKRIEARTRGNPFFIEEVVQMLVESGVLSGRRGARELARPGEAIAVPESVQTVLAARIDQLAEREKRVLQTAAVIGKQVPLPLLSRVTELSDLALGTALARLGDAEFLHESSQSPRVEYEFKHPLTEAVAYESQLRERRAGIHAAVGRAIEEFERDRLDEQAARLAYHWEAAGEALEAARWHRRAAEWIGLAEPSEALQHWRRVRQLARTLDSRTAAGLVALACYQTLNFGWRLGLKADEMRSAVAECRRSSGRIDDPALIVRVLCAYAVYLNFRGRVSENIEPLTEALQIARGERSTDMEIDVLLTLQDSTWYLGRLREAEQFCTRVIELTGEDTAHVNFGGTSSSVESLAKRGGIRAELGRHREAHEDIERALSLSDAESLDENLLAALMVAVRAAELSGDAVESLPRSRRLSELALKTGSPLWTLSSSMCCGVAHLINEEWHEAIGLLEHAVERIDDRGLATLDLGRALIALAQAHLGAGRLDEAVSAAVRAVRTCRTRGMKSWECMARIVLANARLAKEGVGARRKVREGLKRAERLVEETGAEAYRPFIYTVRAALAKEGSDAAEKELREAHRLFVATGATSHAERVARSVAALGKS